jgi:hypothetical protein
VCHLYKKEHWTLVGEKWLYFLLALLGFDDLLREMKDAIMNYEGIDYPVDRFQHPQWDREAGILCVPGKDWHFSKRRGPPG